MNLYETLNELDSLCEAQKIKFNKENLAPSANSIFKFLSSVSDLNSALQSKLIWPNIRNDGLQYDEYCNQLNKSTGVSWGFISLTTEPTKVALELRRPFGIELDVAPLIAEVDRLGYKYRAFNQMDSTKVPPSPDKKASDYIRLNGIGKRKDGSLWMVLQGQYEPRDISEATYNSLLAWLKDNTNGQLVHFIFNNVDKVRSDKYTVRDFYDETGSLAKITTEIDDNGKEITKCTNGNFSPACPAQKAFTKFIDDKSEMWVTGLNTAIGLTAMPGKYKPHIYNNQVRPLMLYTAGTPYDLDETTSKELLEVLDEYEYRIYLPTNKTFRFNAAWIKSIRLPDYYPIRWSGSKFDRDIALKNVFEDFDKAIDKSDETLFNICNDNKVMVELENEEIIRLYRLLDKLNLLASCSFFSYATPESGNNPNFKINDMKSALQDEPNVDGIYGTDVRTRFLAPKSKLSPIFSLPLGTKADATNEKYRLIKLVDKKGFPSIVWRDFPAKDGLRNARLEVRGIILGHDEEDNWYINVVSKGKNDSFDELPGGSFDTKPTSESGLLPIAAKKFTDETGITIQASDLILLNDLTYAYEYVDKYIKDITKGTDLLWNITVDWTFLAILPDTVDVTTKQINEDGYSKWLLLDHAIVSNENFMLRYRNLRNILQPYISSNAKNSTDKANESYEYITGWEDIHSFNELVEENPDRVLTVVVTDKRFTPAMNKNQKQVIIANNVKIVANTFNGVVLKGKASDILAVCDACSVMNPSKVANTLLID